MYIHQSNCISAQQTFGEIDLETIAACEDNILKINEPKYDGIPLGTLRRMGKAVRVGVGCALPLISQAEKVDGIVIGTANGGMEDCIKFLNQIVQYEEGSLTPTNFVQSTPNAIAAQIGLITSNKGYNITHVHRGLAFENALLDVKMMLQENDDHTYLLGGLDEISTYNYNIEHLGNWYKQDKINNNSLYESASSGSIAGEGVAMFLMNNRKEGSVAKVIDIATFHGEETEEISGWTETFLKKNGLAAENINLLISGENGDCRLNKYYELIEKIIPEKSGIVRYKHFSGEYPTSSSFALWLSLQFITMKKIPTHFIKRNISSEKGINTILIYNTYKGLQHSFYLIKL